MRNHVQGRAGPASGFRRLGSLRAVRRDFRRDAEHGANGWHLKHRMRRHHRAARRPFKPFQHPAPPATATHGRGDRTHAPPRTPAPVPRTPATRPPDAGCAAAVATRPVAWCSRQPGADGPVWIDAPQTDPQTALIDQPAQAANPVASTSLERPDPNPPHASMTQILQKRPKCRFCRTASNRRSGSVERRGSSCWCCCWSLLVALAVQILLSQRDRIAALEPAPAPCCWPCVPGRAAAVAPLRQIESVVIDSSSFSRIRGDDYRLGFSLKNNAPIDIAMPAIELALTDPQDQRGHPTCHPARRIRRRFRFARPCIGVERLDRPQRQARRQHRPHRRLPFARVLSLTRRRRSQHGFHHLRLAGVRHHHEFRGSVCRADPARATAHPQCVLPGAVVASRLRRLRRQHRLQPQAAGWRAPCRWPRWAAMATST